LISAAGRSAAPFKGLLQQDFHHSRDAAPIRFRSLVKCALKRRLNAKGYGSVPFFLRRFFRDRFWHCQKVYCKCMRIAYISCMAAIDKGAET
jgi:hypothetical protein